MNIAFDLADVGEMKRFVIDEGCRHFDQRHIARETAIIPPVALDGGDVVQGTVIVDGDDDGVSAVLTAVVISQSNGVKPPS